jgi:hypothetical protein
VTKPMICPHCGKEMYPTPADGPFHKSEQAAVDCYRVLTSKNEVSEGFRGLVRVVPYPYPKPYGETL